MSSIDLRHSLSLNTGQVVLDSFMSIEISAETVLVQIRFKAEDFLRDFLILTFDTLKLSFSLIEMQTLCFELNVSNRVALAKAISW